MIRAIAIDDEPAALEVLTRYAEKIPFLELKKVFYSAAEALRYLQEEELDLIFIDIQMPDMLGTDLARLLQNRNLALVFTTAYTEYAVEGFTLQALDYLLKPFDFARFLQTCNRALERMGRKKGEGASIFVKEGYDWVRVHLDEVNYIQSDTNLLFIYEKKRRITTRMTLSEMLTILPEDRFVRVHKSYIVALQAVEKIERHQLTIAGVLIPLASTYRETVEKMLLGMKK
jgi:two-component system, LytTR family, response regulator